MRSRASTTVIMHLRLPESSSLRALRCSRPMVEHFSPPWLGSVSLQKSLPKYIALTIILINIGPPRCYCSFGGIPRHERKREREQGSYWNWSLHAGGIDRFRLFMRILTPVTPRRSIYSDWCQYKLRYMASIIAQAIFYFFEPFHFV